MVNQSGMSYVGFCGLTTPMKNHAERVFAYARNAADVIADFNTEHGTAIDYRIAIHTGPMFGALIGNYSMAYEIWGEAVMTASELAQDTPIGTLRLSQTTRDQIDLDKAKKSVTVTLNSGEKIKVSSVALGGKARG